LQQRADCHAWDVAHLKVLAVDALAVVGAVDGRLEALAVLLKAAALLAVAALVVARRRARRQRCNVVAALLAGSMSFSWCLASLSSQKPFSFICLRIMRQGMDSVSGSWSAHAVHTIPAKV
jgi:hypothetical protein